MTNETELRAHRRKQARNQTNSKYNAETKAVIAAYFIVAAVTLFLGSDFARGLFGW